MSDKAASLVSERTAEALRAQYDGELPPPFAISDDIPDGWVLDTRLLYAQPKRACRNCGLPISEAPRRRARYLGHADVGGSSTGWIHDSGSPVLGWQGVRCPGRITGALPMELPEVKYGSDGEDEPVPGAAE